MRYIGLLVTVSLLLVAFGCSQPPPQVKTSSTTKQQVLTFVKKTKENPKSKSVAADAEMLLESLKATQEKASDNGPIYAELSNKCKELIETAKPGAGFAEVSKKLDEMAEIANKLPD